jgi:hypothetical protein
LTGVIWIPFGVSDVTGGEEWALLASIESPEQSPNPSRPLITFVFALAHFIFRDSLTGAFSLLILLIFGKSLACYGILSQLFPQQKVLAFGTGALLMVFPIENVTYQLTFLNYHFVIFTLLTSTCFLLWHYQYPKWWKVIGMWMCLLPTTLIVEATYPLLAVIPGLILWQEKRLTKSFVILCLFWYLIPAISGTYMAINLFLTPTSSTYQESLIASDNSIPTLLEVSWTIFRGHFWERWLPALNLSAQTIQEPFAQLSLLTVMVTGGILFFLKRGESAFPIRDLLQLFLIALVATVLGYIVFIIISSRLTFVRTTILSVPGAALLITCLLFLMVRLPHWGRVICSLLMIIAMGVTQLAIRDNAIQLGFPSALLIFACIALVFTSRLAIALMLGGLIGLGMTYTLTLRDMYRDTDYNTEFMQQVSLELPKLASNTTVILVVDAGGAPFASSFLRLRGALRWLYEEHTLEGYFCDIDQDSAIDRLRCIFNSSTIEPSGIPPTRYQTTYDRVIFLRFTAADHSLTLWDEEQVEAWIGHPIEGYDPYRRIDLDGVPPRRYFTLFPNQTAYPPP